MTKIHSAMAVGALLALAAPLTARAQMSSADQAVLACRTVKGDRAQLACFRRAADALAGGTAVSGAVAQATPAPPAPAPPAAIPFGAPHPRVVAERPARPHSADLVLVSIGDMGDGRAILNFEDGSTWVEREAEPITSAVKPGQRLHLERGALGSYVLVLPHRAEIRIARLRTEAR